MSNEVPCSQGQKDTEPRLKFKEAWFWSRVSALHPRCCHVHCMSPWKSGAVNQLALISLCNNLESRESHLFQEKHIWVHKATGWQRTEGLWQCRLASPTQSAFLKQKYVVNDVDFRRPPLSSVLREAEAETSCIENEILSQRMTSALSCSSALTSWSIRLWSNTILMLRHLKGKHKHTGEWWVNIKNTQSQCGVQIWNQCGGFKRSL